MKNTSGCFLANPSRRSRLVRSYSSALRCGVLVWLAVVRDAVLAQECATDGTTCDKHSRCPVWKEEGECMRNAKYMKEHCPVSCRDIHQEAVTIDCIDLHERCPVWAGLGECKKNPIDMNRYCSKSCKQCEDDNDGKTNEKEKRGDPDNNSKTADDDDDPQCQDGDKNCPYWAKNGECQTNKIWMTTNCPKSCQTCEEIKPKSPRRASQMKPAEVQEILRASASFGEPQTAEGSQTSDTVDIVRASIDYMNSEDVQQLPSAIVASCRNQHHLCSFWALIGECDANKSYMRTNCAPACQTCQLIDIENRCPRLEHAEPALVPGDLNKLFDRIVRTAPGNRTLTEAERQELVDQKMPLYTAHVHSRPSANPVVEVSTVLDKSLPPWVITLDNFLTLEECTELINIGHKHGYNRSKDVGKVKVDGTHEAVQSTRRTSENAWCSNQSGCRDEALPQLLHERMATVMRIPAQNSEDFQLLKYEKGQFYRTHHDFIQHQTKRQCGPRILTFFLYLSDVTAGGGTNFPDLDITVEPKAGRALLWPSVYDSDPMAKDGRMMHQALEVEDGVKFAANGWIHMYDYVTPQSIGCT
jgi:prolyl 4-hydroxylase